MEGNCDLCADGTASNVGNDANTCPACTSPNWSASDGKTCVNACTAGHVK